LCTVEFASTFRPLCISTKCKKFFREWQLYFWELPGSSTIFQQMLVLFFFFIWLILLSGLNWGWPCRKHKSTWWQTLYKIEPKRPKIRNLFQYIVSCVAWWNYCSCFRNVVFSSYLEFRVMGKVHKSSDSWCYTPSSEPFRLYLENMNYWSLPQYVSTWLRVNIRWPYTMCHTAAPITVRHIAIPLFNVIHIFNSNSAEDSFVEASHFNILHNFHSWNVVYKAAYCIPVIRWKHVMSHSPT
jgi:hypothetical protein